MAGEVLVRALGRTLGGGMRVRQRWRKKFPQPVRKRRKVKRKRS